MAFLKVSIPFKREGTFRRLILSGPPFRDEALSGFQFPSNGKAHSDVVVKIPVVKLVVTSSFNSLQTGRHIQTL